MLESRIYNIFISHSWKYNSDYVRLVNLLRKATYFNWKNYSVSWSNPLIGGSRKKLAREIDNQIRLATVVLVVSGIYVTYSEWIDYEIAVADKYNKAIIGVRPFGSIKIPSSVTISAVETVKWNTNSIINSIVRNTS